MSQIKDDPLIDKLYADSWRNGHGQAKDIFAQFQTPHVAECGDHADRRLRHVPGGIVQVQELRAVSHSPAVGRLAGELNRAKAACCGSSIRRLVSSVPVLALVSLLPFGVIWLVPGDPASVFLGPGATSAQLAATCVSRAGPGSTVLAADDGLVRAHPARRSRAVHPAQPQRRGGHHRAVAGHFVADRLALVFAVVMGVTAGLLAAMRHRSWADQSIMAMAWSVCRSRSSGSA